MGEVNNSVLSIVNLEQNLAVALLWVSLLLRVPFAICMWLFVQENHTIR